MIASLNGIVKLKSHELIIIEVSGVGYKVQVSSQTFAQIPAAGKPVSLLIHTAVREDDISLFGFIDEQEQRLFQRLITVSGIGPRLALVVLSGIPPRDLIEALAHEDLVRLTAIPGIGRKTAERMIVDLKDKLIDLFHIKGSERKTARGEVFEEAISALTNLGYPRSAAERTLTKVKIRPESSLESVVRDALKVLAEIR